VFAGADIAATARLAWLGGCPQPRFEDDVWSFVGWADAPVHPLLTANFQHLLRPTGHRDIHKTLFVRARPLLEEAVAEVGTEYLWCRNPANAPRADTGELIPWSLPLSNRAADALIRVAGHACKVATSALTGMRSSEPMELTVGCRRMDDADGTGLARHRLVLWPERFAGKLAASGAVHRKAEHRPRTGCTRVMRQRGEVSCRASRAGEPFRSQH
jgi:hypothetical protein